MNLTPCKENRGYSDHTESTESKKKSLQVEKSPSELRSALYDVNETPRSCRSELCGGHTSYYVYMDMDAAARFDLRILWYLRCFVIYSIKIGLF